MYVASLMVLVRWCDSVPAVANYTQTGLMSFDVGMFLNEERGLKMFLESFTKDPCRVPNVSHLYL